MKSEAPRVIKSQFELS